MMQAKGVAGHHPHPRINDTFAKFLSELLLMFVVVRPDAAHHTRLRQYFLGRHTLQFLSMFVEVVIPLLLMLMRPMRHLLRMFGVRCHFVHSVNQLAFGGEAEGKQGGHDHHGCSGGPVGSLFVCLECFRETNEMKGKKMIHRGVQRKDLVHLYESWTVIHGRVNFRCTTNRNNQKT